MNLRSGLLKVLLLAFVALLLGAACGSDDEGVSADADAEVGARVGDGVEAEAEADVSADPGSSRMITQDQNGEEVALKPAEAATVALETCPGCGYEWRITSEPDAKVVVFEGSENQRREQPADGPPIVGGNEMIHFDFRATGPGTTTVEIGYFPPAMDDAEETFSVTFVVS